MCFPSCIWIFLLLNSFCYAVQQFDNEPVYTEINPGGNAKLACKIFNKRGQCSWQKDGKPVGIYAGKYEWAGSPETGDCSLLILSGRIEYDDGEWECQVTASTFDSQDALTSMPVRVVVRVPPTTPVIETNFTQINGNLSARVNQVTSTKCTSRNGNPPAVLKWFLDEVELLPTINQTNITEIGSTKRWMSTITLDYVYTKRDHGRVLRCVAIHEAFPTKSSSVSAKLDVQYAAEVTLIGAPTKDLEENVDSVKVTCKADANPPATVIWRKLGSTDIYSFQETLDFSLVRRQDSGTYTCEAKNTLGSSSILSFNIDVKYGPTILSLGPAVGSQLTATLFSSAEKIECRAEGNPPPSYRWLQKMPGENNIIIRSEDKFLIIPNVTYEFQGEYVCSATNVIGNKERIAQSDPLTIRVVGPPQLLHEATARHITVDKGDDVILRATFCADPRPQRTIWQWGTSQLEAGAGQGRFVAEALQKVGATNVDSIFAQAYRTNRHECYEAKMRIQRVEMADARHYYFLVENEKGADTLHIALSVKEPIAMATVIAVVIACLVFIIFLSVTLVYCYRTNRCCFRSPDVFKKADFESAKSSVFGSRTSPASHTSRSSVSDRSAPLDVSKDEAMDDDTGMFANPTVALTNPHQYLSPPSTTSNASHHEGHEPHTAASTNECDDTNLGNNTDGSKFHSHFQKNTKRKYPVDRRDLIYADLQLPKTSNNGSMRVKTANKNHHHSNQANDSSFYTIEHEKAQI